MNKNIRGTKCLCPRFHKSYKKARFRKAKQRLIKWADAYIEGDKTCPNQKND